MLSISCLPHDPGDFAAIPIAEGAAVLFGELGGHCEPTAEWTAQVFETIVVCAVMRVELSGREAFRRNWGTTLGRTRIDLLSRPGTS